MNRIFRLCVLMFVVSLFSVGAQTRVQAMDANDRLLVWLGNGAAPGQHDATAAGQVAYIDAAGGISPVLDLPAGTRRVSVCGDDGLSPDGRYFTFFAGGDRGSLYLVQDVDAPQLVGEVDWLTCLGENAVRFSDDSARLGYIAYTAGATLNTFAQGSLHVRTSADLSALLEVQNVTAFDLSDDGAAYINFYTNTRNEADEAAVMWWDGTSQREVATLLAETDCQYTGAEIAIAPDGNFALIIGHKCRAGDTRTRWQMYTIDRENRVAALTNSDYQPGVFPAFARANNVFFSPDGETIYFTVPDGLTANSVALATANVADMALGIAVERQLVFATYSGNVNAPARRSYDGQYLAGVVTSPDNVNNLAVIDLADTSSTPIMLSAGSKGDTVSSLVFTADNKTLYYTAGGSNGENNSVFTLDLSTASDARVARGRFGSALVVSPAGDEFVALDWQPAPDGVQQPYANLVLINPRDGLNSTLYTGATIEEGKIVKRQFAQPLAWRTTAP